MGLGGGTTLKKYVTINNNDFTIRCNENVEGATCRKLKKGPNEGKEVFELRYSELSGIITSMKEVKKDFGDFIEVTIKDQEDFILQIPWSDFTVRDALIKRLPNLNPGKVVVFKVWENKENGRTAFAIQQDDEWIKYAYTKDNPNGMPQPEKTNVRGVDKWDFTNVENFLYDEFQKHSKKFNQVLDVQTAEEILSENPTDEDMPF